MTNPELIEYVARHELAIAKSEALFTIVLAVVTVLVLVVVFWTENDRQSFSKSIFRWIGLAVLSIASFARLSELPTHLATIKDPMAIAVRIALKGKG